MINKYTRTLLLLILLLPVTVFAQQSVEKLFNKHTRHYVNYQLAAFVTDKKYFSARNLTDSLDIEIRTPAELQSVIKAGLKDRVYSVMVDNSDSTDLGGIMKQLAGFDKLNYLKIQDLPLFFLAKKKSYQLPASITQLQHLEGIEFDSQVIDMPDAVEKMAALKSLQMIQLGFYNKALPAKFSLLNIKAIAVSAKNLDSIDVSNVKWQMVKLLGNMPKEGPDQIALSKLSQIPSLKKLYVEYAMLGDCEALSQFKQLEDLSLHVCESKKGTSVFEKLSGLKNLHNLSINWLKDSTMQLSGIEKLSNLQGLQLISTNLLALHPEDLGLLKDLKNLKALDLTSNNLKTLPDIFTGMNLESVNLSGNQFTETPRGLFNMRGLLYLDLSANKLNALPESMVCAQLKSLKVNYNALTALPEALTHFTQLEFLSVASNKISVCPLSGWQNLKHLKTADLSMNRITTFPDGLQQISALEYLTISNNDISSIPDLKGGNYRMKILNLGSNDLTALPEHIGKYEKLENLDAAGNMLTDLPASLGNCVKLKQLDLHSESRKSIFNSNKTGMGQFEITQENNVHLNRIKSLPEGLKNAAELYQLNVNGNVGIDGASVFKVILGRRRPYFNADLSGDGISQVPASDEWANMEFYTFNLSNDKISSLPADFAYISRYQNIYLKGNPIQTSTGLGVEAISSHEDMKLLFDEMGIATPDLKVSPAGYADAMAKRVTLAYSKKQYAQAVAYANKAIVFDGAAYAKQVSWEDIGLSRFYMKDYQGAINDFDRFIAKQSKTFMHWGPSLTVVEQYKAQAQLALGQVEQAAETHLYFARKYGNEAAMQKAAILYKKSGNETRYHQLMDTTLLNYQKNFEASKKTNPNYINVATVLDYAEVLIMAEKAADAIKVLDEQNPKIYSNQYLSIKNYLLASANFMMKPDDYDAVKQGLADNIKAHGKVTGWDFTMFNSWVDNSGMTEDRKTKLLSLQAMVK